MPIPLTRSDNKKSLLSDSNRRPSHYKYDALAPELRRQGIYVLLYIVDLENASFARFVYLEKLLAKALYFML